jgi:hypothetical protein
MNINRTATIVVVGAALAAWLAAAATSGPRDANGVNAIKPVPIATQGDVLAGEISRLHERLHPVAVPRQPSRNLFSYTARPAAPAPLPPPSRRALTEASIAAPAPPTVKLSGIAEDVVADGVVRTAVISGFGQLFLVKEGENVTARYRVAKISSEVVELSDLTDGSVLRLALK